MLALAVGLAELATPWIVAVMAVGWVLVAVVEWLAWRTEAGARRACLQGARASAPEEQTSWDIEEILAPVPDEQGSTHRPAERRAVRPVLGQRLVALAAAALLAGVFGVALSQAGRDSTGVGLAGAGRRLVGRLDDGAGRRGARGASGGQAVRL